MIRGKPSFFATVGVVLGLLALAACSTPTEMRQQDTSFDRTAADDVFASAFENISDKYIDPLPLDDVGLEGLRGLGAIDPAVTAERDGADLVLVVSGREVARRPAPGPRDARAWGTLTTEMAVAGRKVSDTLAAADSERIYEAVFDGLLARLDLYSRYAGADEARRNRARRDGFGGIGVRYQIEEGTVRITEIMPGTPADEAGLETGDLVTHVDERPLSGLDVDEVGHRIRGPVHTRVMLTVARDGMVAPFVVELARAHIVPETVYVSVVGKVALVQVRSFNQDTANSLERKLKRMLGEYAVDGIVLDLRSNPGGLLRQSVEVADLLLAHGQIVSTRGRHPDSLHDYRAEAQELAKDLPLVALVDGKSASAAEIVAAALQDRNRAVVLGTNSFGKGTVQTVIRLPNDGELTLTWSRLVAPSGYVLHGLGVMPALCTSGGPLAQNEAAFIDTALKDLAAHPARFATWRRPNGADDSTRQKLRAACPSERRSGDFDLDLARRIITERPLYSQLLAMSGTLEAPQAANLARQMP